MEDKLYIVVYRQKPGSRWQSFSDGLFTERRLAENFIECKNSTGWDNWQLTIIEGPIVSPETMAAAEARLGPF